MDRMTLMIARVFAPAIGALLIGCALFATGQNLEGQSLLSALAREWFFLGDAALGVALVLLVICAVRLRRWIQGDSLVCPHCGGLLGREREGRYGEYRRCLACDKNIAHINYA